MSRGRAFIIAEKYLDIKRECDTQSGEIGELARCWGITRRALRDIAIEVYGEQTIAQAEEDELRINARHAKFCLTKAIARYGK